MILPTVALAAGEELAVRLAPALEAAGFQVTRLGPEEVHPDLLRTLAPRLLVLESITSVSLERILPYWEDQPMEEHLAVLLLEPPEEPAFSLDDLDEPVDRAAPGADSGEIVARARGLMRERIIRLYRRHFHDLSQPVTVARAFSQRAVRLLPPGDALQPTLAELDRQVERIFRIAEDLQRRRME